MNHTRICILFIMLLQSLLFSNSNEQSEKLDSLFKLATSHYFNEEFDLAYEYSIKCLEIAPNHAYAHFYIGDYYGFQADFEKALNHYNIAIENHKHEVFELAYYQRAITKIVLNLDLSYCNDIDILKELFKKDDEFKYLEEEHEIVFGLCEASRTPHLLINSANFLAENGYCMYALMFYNEASKNATLDELSKYDKSICKGNK